MKRLLLWALVLLVPMAFYVIGVTFGQPYPAYAPSIEQRDWLHGSAVYHPDEFAYVGKPYRMVLQREWNPHYYHNPSLNIYSNMALFVLGDAQAYPHHLDYDDRAIAPFQLYVMARYMSALYALLTVALTYAAGRVAFGRMAGVIAAGLVAFSPLMVEHAHYATPNAQTMMLSAAALLLALVIVKGRVAPRVPLWLIYGAAGLLVGLTMAARYNAAAIGLVTALAMLTVWWRERRHWGLVLLGFAMMPLGFVSGMPGSVLATREVIDQIRDILDWYRARGGGPGFTSESKLRAFYYHWRYLALAGIGVPALISAVWGAWRALRTWRSPRWQDAWIAAVLLLYMLVYTWIALPGSRLQANLLFPLILPLALLAGYPFEMLRAKSPAMRRAAMWLGGVLWVWPVVFGLLFVYWIDVPDTREKALAWLYDHVPRGSSVYLLEPYNVPVDPLDYDVMQTFGGEAAPQQVRNADAQIIIYSDALPHSALRDPATASARAIARERAIREVLEREWVELAHFERMPWPFAGLSPDDVSYWFQMGITIYCNPDNCPVE